MKNVTITLNEEVALWARVRAARDNTSVSRLVGEMLREKMLQEDGYEAAMQRYFATPARPLKRGGRYPSRQALHDR